MQNPVLDPLAPNANLADLPLIFERQKQNQYTVARSTVKERKAKLQRLYDCVLKYRSDIEAAMWADFRKCSLEINLTETGIVLTDIRHILRNLDAWAAPKRVGTPLALLGSSSEIWYEPKGVCLIVSPWNYPFNLTLSPLALAIAAGNCVILKPSEYTVNSSALMKKIVEECFSPDEVALVEGDASVSEALLELPFNHIFFTGSPAVGKVVMAAAAKHLSSVTLELGGKSPVVVDETADLDVAAAKICWLKGTNAGQICIAPDYVLVHESKYEALVQKMIETWKRYYGPDPATRQASPDYCRLASRRQFFRVKSLLDDAVQQGGTVSFGGHTDESERYIEPTLLTNVPDSARIWSEEIFGPLLLIRTWKTIDEAIQYINQKPTSLAFYPFSRSRRKVDYLLKETRSGSVCVNDCGPQFYNGDLPFGGHNNSGIGKSHGEFGFHEFSNARSVLRQTRFLPTTGFMLPPYGNWFSKLLVEGVVRWF